MFPRIDRLRIDLPVPKAPAPDAAAAVQEPPGGRFGEMPTSMDHRVPVLRLPGAREAPSVPCPDRRHRHRRARPHRAGLGAGRRPLDGIPGEGDPATGAAGPGKAFEDARLSHRHIGFPHAATVANSTGRPRRGDYVFNSGNLVPDLPHDLFLACGARTHKLRVHEMTDDPAARRMPGHLFVRGGVHAHACALAPGKLAGIEIGKMLPIPGTQNVRIPESRPFEESGPHRELHRFSPDDCREIAAIRQGRALDGSAPPEVVGGPPEGGALPDPDDVSDAFVPESHPEEICEIARKLWKKATG